LTLLTRLARTLPVAKTLVRRLDDTEAGLREELDTMRSQIDVDEQLFESLDRYRRSADYDTLYRQESPLVSVCVTTYNRSALLAERCLASVRAQRYANMEIVIVGDCCTDDTESVVRAMQDPRIRFVNLTERERYPEDPDRRWMVAGTASGNLVRSLAAGELVTHLDDDDEFMPDRISKLVRFLQETRSELVWHPFLAQAPSGKWQVNDAERFALGKVTTGSVLYRSWCTEPPADARAYRWGEPGDWNRFRKLKYLGVRMERCPDVLLRHYRERQNP